MAVTKKPKEPGYIVLKNVRLSYAWVWEKHAADPKPGEEPQKPCYSVSLMWPKKDKVQTEKVKAAIKAAMASDKGKDRLKGKTEKSKNFKYPLYDGDEDRPEDSNYAGMMYVNAKSDEKPNIVDQDLNKILDKEEVYSGCYCNVSITFFAFNNKSVGVGAGLGNLQFVKDGEKFSSRTTAEDDFSSEEDDEEYEVEEDDDDLV